MYRERAGAGEEDGAEEKHAKTFDFDFGHILLVSSCVSNPTWSQDMSGVVTVSLPETSLE